MPRKKKDIQESAKGLLDLMDGFDSKAQEATKTMFSGASFKKPNSDYYRLDLIVRDTVNGKMTETIKKDYRDYITTMTDGKMSITRYIHKLLDEDMEKNKKYFEEKKRLIEEKVSKERSIKEDAHKQRLYEATMLLEGLGYKEQPDGTWKKPE